MVFKKMKKIRTGGKIITTLLRNKGRLLAAVKSAKKLSKK